MSETADLVLFEKKERIFPKRVWGRYRKLKWLAMLVTLAIYYLAPFIRWDRGPNAPDQAILIDMANSRAYFFFIEIWPQEIYYITGILILAAISLFFVTSLFGRVWCGYTCPQTVWTDLFVWVERIVQGDRAKRLKLYQAKWSLEKIGKLALTHILWLLIGLMTGGAWVFYFNDAPTLIEQIMHFDVPFSVWIWIVALTLSTYIMAGFAREQVCMYMCPYSRFQSAMFDKDTLIIGYDEERGEPRTKGTKKLGTAGQGDCIDCTLCVQVCPAGIDIRDGLQMECIACGLCVDACNNVMAKIERPLGLIRYDTAHNQERRSRGLTEKAQIVRPRTLYYSLIIAIIGVLMLIGLINRTPLDMSVLHDRNPLYVTLSSGDIRNGYDIKILNKTHEDRSYRLSTKGIKDAVIRVDGAGSLSADNLTVYANSVGHFRIFVTAPKQPTSRTAISFDLTEIDGDANASYQSIFQSGQ